MLHVLYFGEREDSMRGQGDVWLRIDHFISSHSRDADIFALTASEATAKFQEKKSSTQIQRQLNNRHQRQSP